MEEKMQVSTEGKDLTIAFNVRYITDVQGAFRRTDCDALQLNVSPCVICPVEGESYLYLVLPVHIQRVRRRGLRWGAAPHPGRNLRFLHLPSRLSRRDKRRRRPGGLRFFEF
ncbi:MAG: hypothetical protein ACLS6G_14735 [Christensenellales bacterium]